MADVWLHKEDLESISNAVNEKLDTDIEYNIEEIAPIILSADNEFLNRTIEIYNDNIITNIGSYAFHNCTLLTTVNLSNVTSIESRAFYNCSSLTSFTLSGSTVCELINSNAFDSTPIESGSGYIYVPAELVDTYKAANNWSTYANHIRAIN